MSEDQAIKGAYGPHSFAPKKGEADQFLAEVKKQTALMEANLGVQDAIQRELDEGNDVCSDGNKGKTARGKGEE